MHSENKQQKVKDEWHRRFCCCSVNNELLIWRIFCRAPKIILTTTICFAHFTSHKFEIRFVNGFWITKLRKHHYATVAQQLRLAIIYDDILFFFLCNKGHFVALFETFKFNIVNFFPHLANDYIQPTLASPQRRTPCGDANWFWWP